MDPAEEEEVVEGDSPEQKRGKREFSQRFLVVFLGYFATALIGQYVFYAFHTSPAVFWPPVGIAIAALLLWGYEQWIPVALAQLLAALASPGHPATQSVIAGVVAYTMQPLIGAYILKSSGFRGSMARVRDALTLIVVSLAVPALAPGLTTATQWSLGLLQTSFWAAWSRGWAGGILSALILIPLITSWSSPWQRNLSRKKLLESVLAIGALIVVTYFLFWTKLPALNPFVMIFLFFAIFFWIGLRLRPALMTLGLFLATVFGITGSIVAHPTAAALNIQLLSDELFMILVAPIFLILVTLVTERRIATRALQKEATELQGALKKLSLEDNSKNEFIAMLAHELRNPLAPVASTLEYLRLEEQDPERLEAIKGAEQQMRIVRRLLDDLLDVARVTQKKFRLQKEMVTVETVASQAVTAAEAFLESQGHQLSVSLPEEPIWLDADPVRITQVITNLIFNAGKYTPPGGNIKLSARREGDLLVLTVKDDGMGIAPEMLSIVFEPFMQVPRTARVGTGLGIGLSITKRLVEMHGGSITAASEGVNMGSTFSIRLPLPKETEAPLTPKNQFPPLKPAGKSLRILVTDDNESAARAIQKLLQYRGHEVVIVHSGEAALEAVASFKPQVALLDIGLPDMTGYEVAKQIRSSGFSLYLIALTGYGQEEDRLEAKEAGFQAHLTKPVGLAEIEGVLEGITGI